MLLCCTWPEKIKVKINSSGENRLKKQNKKNYLNQTGSKYIHIITPVWWYRENAELRSACSDQRGFWAFGVCVCVC